MIIEPHPFRGPAHDSSADADIPADVWQLRVTVQPPTSTYMGDPQLGWAEAAGVIKTWRPDVLAAFQTTCRDKIEAIETALENGVSPLALQQQAAARVQQARHAVLAAFLHLEAEERAARHVEKIQTAHYLRR
jgi:hypothetical protein